LDFYLWGPLKP